ncbi:MAG: hypothetical protein HWE25_07105 [Alphaproteobacteria bacterium]|nr:hypothetical protein [Alphaproteobacteria bacterium]
MMIGDMTSETEERFQDLAAALHLCLRENQAILAQQGMAAELGALIYWIKQVTSRNLTIRDAVAGNGLLSLLTMRERLLLSLEEHPRVSAEVENTASVVDHRQEDCRKAFSAVSDALDAFLMAVAEAHEGRAQNQIK